ncbi:MAG: hypothetical protein ACREQ9_01360 [Candidatus Binatia bacterium]
MQPSNVLTNVRLIRDFPSSREPAREVQPSLPVLVPDRTQRLIERWHAPVMSEEEIEAWATRYRLCPKTGMSFVEYLIVRGVGTAG